jgi:hypothetical protein
MVKPMPYPEVYPPEDDFHPLAVGRTFFMDTFDEAAGETITHYLSTSTAMMAVAHLRVLGGAMARIPADATAFAHRKRRIMANVAALYQPPDAAATHQGWVNAFAEALSQGEPGAYVNFLGDEGTDRDREAYPGSTWDRLAAVKAQYDPGNLFRLNHNIPPATT